MSKSDLRALSDFYAREASGARPRWGHRSGSLTGISEHIDAGRGSVADGVVEDDDPDTPPKYDHSTSPTFELKCSSDRSLTLNVGSAHAERTKTGDAFTMYPNRRSTGDVIWRHGGMNADECAIACSKTVRKPWYSQRLRAATPLNE